MQNVAVSVKGKKLVVEIDLEKDFGPSKSGKTMIVASTGGFQAIGETGDGYAYALNLNVVKRVKK